MPIDGLGFVVCVYIYIYSSHAVWERDVGGDWREAMCVMWEREENDGGELIEINGLKNV